MLYADESDSPQMREWNMRINESNSSIRGVDIAYHPHPGKTLAAVVEWAAPSCRLIGKAAARSLARRI